ncbi:hypothetical protein PFLUV_G00081250 [Perca fluviatilis]|uniref:Uncharacterized protein n=1 Tax=Perca fluviatilis TaxID=8168 RepID=A0A6A5EEB5_PERFL|nr:hypothetical protein PFLUV_G00081250 [Perca fluviatilis]
MDPPWADTGAPIRHANTRFGIVRTNLSVAPKRWAGSILSCSSRRSASTGADTVSDPGLHYTTPVPSPPGLHLLSLQPLILPLGKTGLQTLIPETVLCSIPVLLKKRAQFCIWVPVRARPPGYPSVPETDYPPSPL